MKGGIYIDNNDNNIFDNKYVTINIFYKYNVLCKTESFVQQAINL